MSFVVYGTPADQFSAKYPFTTEPFSPSQDIRTQLPKNITILRAVATAAFTTLIAFKVSTTIFFWSVTLLGTCFTAQTLYSHLKDPLVEAFYTIDKQEIKTQEIRGKIEKVNEFFARLIANEL